MTLAGGAKWDAGEPSHGFRLYMVTADKSAAKMNADEIGWRQTVGLGLLVT